MLRFVVHSAQIRFAHILFLLPLLIIFCSCSDDDPTDPANPNGNTIIIGVEGGSFTMNDQVHLHVPAGTVFTPTTFGLDEIYFPPEPPEGCIQVGPAFSASIGGGADDALLALAMEFDHSFTGELTGKIVFLSRWNESSGWEAIETQGGYFPLGLGVTVRELGTFAAHLDTTAGEPDDVFSSITMSSAKSLGDATEEPVWRTTIFANFLNSDQTVRLWDAGGPVLVGDFNLGAENYYASSLHDVDPGSSFHVIVPGSDIIPALDDSLHYFDADLILTNPPQPGETINPLESFRITWEGAGPQLVWLTIYGDGADGSFSFHGKMRPNTGEFVFTPEILSTFESGAEVTVFLQRTQARSLSHPGFHHSSYFLVESVSSMKVFVQ